MTDAYGREIWDYFSGSHSQEIVERDDGYLTAGDGPARYFTGYREWLKREQAAIRFARGRTALDVGCGAGRVALYLQTRGFRVTAIDNSPLAIRTAKKRGAKGARLLRFEDMSRLRATRFDTVVMFGNNFGLFGSYRRARRLLKQLHRMTSLRAVLIAESLDPHQTSDRAHIAYAKRNKARGRMAGQLRIRLRYHELIGPWFEYLLVSPDEMNTVLDGTGWTRTRLIRDDSPSYFAIIEKEHAS